MAKGRRFYTFPILLMSGWWESYSKFKSCLFNGLDYCIMSYTYECGFTNDTADDVVVKAVKESFNLSCWDYEEANHIITKMRRDKKIYDSYWSKEKVAFFSISCNVFWNFVKNEKSWNDMILFMSFSSLKSLLDGRKIIKTNRYALTARMACHTSSRKTDNLPEEIAIYQRRKRYERLKRELYQYRKVGFYSDNGIRGVYVTLMKDENGEPDMTWLIENSQKMEAQISTKHAPLKEAIKPAKERRCTNVHLRTPKYTTKGHL